MPSVEMVSTLAQDLAARYAAGGNVAAVLMAGSYGRGRADEHSDLEIDVYWIRPPSDKERLYPAHSLDGVVQTLWEFDPDDAELSEDLVLGDIDITISGFTASWLEQTIKDVTVHADPTISKQMRLSALNDGMVLYGHDQVTRWRTDSTRYPDALAQAVAAHYLAPGRLQMWRRWRALADRGDLLALRTACGTAATAIAGSLCGVNRVLIEHPHFKWVHQLLPRLPIAPTDFERRFLDSMDAGAAQCAHDLDGLLRETSAVVAEHLPQALAGTTTGE